MKIEYKLKIERDEFGESPDSWQDTNIFLVYDHRQFDVKRKGFEPRAIYDHLNAKEIIVKNERGDELETYQDDLDPKYEDYYIFGVDAYIHSGVVLSLTDDRDFPDRQWDVSTTGYILASKQEYKDEEIARNGAKCLIDTWNQYISGDVWGYQVVKETTCNCCNNTKEEFVDSCWGFYGLEECKEQGQFALDGFNKHLEI